MIYPEFIKENDTIGVTAPSDGITNPGKINRLNYAIANWRNLGFKVRETESVRKSFKGRSNTSENQAKELESLFLDKDIKAVICATGGDFLIEMLPYLDFDIIKNNPKWLQGYSDPTGLLFTITTNLDIATIYGNNFAAFGMQPWHESLENNIEILKGNRVKQTSFRKCESSWHSYIQGDEPYILDKSTQWESIKEDEEITFHGRLIGGCIDNLTELFGTSFDKTKEFIEKYKKDGIIWYFENYGLTSEELIRTLWKFKNHGWFSYTKGIIFGRSVTEASCYDITLKEVINHSLDDLNIPIIINADVGHVSPRMTFINGAIAHVAFKNRTGAIEFELK